MKHIMVDLETLGTTADSVIMSIGAVRFDLESDKISNEGFYASISIESNLDMRRRVSEDTLIWWLKQSTEAQAVFGEVKTPLREALEDLADWIADDSHFIWSNGADFDLPMLAHAYTQHGLTVPWAFWNSRCFRTYKNLPGAKGARLSHAGVKHNALADAHAQAQNLQAIHAAVFGTKKAVKA